MTDKRNNQNSTLRASQRYTNPEKYRSKPFDSRKGQPFLLPAISFYVLAMAIAVILFFLIWGFLHDTALDNMPWIPAGIISGMIMVCAVVLREIVLRGRRNTLLLAQERLDFNLKNIERQKQLNQDENKLTLEKNAAILKQITEKSEAANVLGKLSGAHWEVFEICNEYLIRTEKELETVRGGSPRIAALKRGREKVRSLHKFHLLAWSSAESRSLIQASITSATMSKKLETAQKALSILDSAKEFYPDEMQLVESADAVREFISGVRISHLIEQAEKCAFKGNYEKAISDYQDALFYLMRESGKNEEREKLAEKINLEIEKIKQFPIEDQIKNTTEKNRERISKND